ncbi:MAG: hypothetical protein M3P23_04320 [Actinomycetota bacterium]|nr:hypothetical protein [Actinomycetota bacterium]
MRFDVKDLPEDDVLSPDYDVLMRFEVKDYPRAALTPAEHEGECMVDDGYDGETCCPLGDVEES